MHAASTPPADLSVLPSVVVMGVAGCGKSAVGRRMAAALQLPMVEGDDFHPPANVARMRAGIARTDADRVGWLAQLADVLQQHPAGAVLSCSALKLAYRDSLRNAVPGLRFVYLHITPAESLRRVADRPGHFYPPSLVTSQFEALQDPSGEPGVLTLDGTAPLNQVAARAAEWIKALQLATGPRPTASP